MNVRVHIINLIKKYGWRRTSPGNPEPLETYIIYNYLNSNRNELKAFIKAVEAGDQMICIDGYVGTKYDEQQKSINQ